MNAASGGLTDLSSAEYREKATVAACKYSWPPWTSLVASKGMSRQKQSFRPPDSEVSWKGPTVTPVLLAEVEGIELLVTGQCICACHRGANASIPQCSAFSERHNYSLLKDLLFGLRAAESRTAILVQADAKRCLMLSKVKLIVNEQKSIIHGLSLKQFIPATVQLDCSIGLATVYTRLSSPSTTTDTH